MTSSLFFSVFSFSDIDLLSLLSRRSISISEIISFLVPCEPL